MKKFFKAIARILFRNYPKLGFLYTNFRQDLEYLWMRERDIGHGLRAFASLSHTKPSYEAAERSAMWQLMEDSSHFIDVGANYGLYSLMACKQGLKVCAVEPLVFNYRLLFRNLRHNRYFTQTKVVIAAVAESTDNRTIFGVGGSASTNRDWKAHNDYSGVDVPALTLDEIAAAFLPDDAIPLLKIDVEGTESSVLRGGTKLLTGGFGPKPTWLVECYAITEANGHRRISEDFLNICEQFFQNGYAAYGLAGGQWHKIHESLSAQNLETLEEFKANWIFSERELTSVLDAA